MFNTDDSCQSFAGVVSSEIRVVILEQAGSPGIIIHCPGNRRPQAGEMGPAVDCVDGVSKGVNGFGVGIRLRLC